MLTLVDHDELLKIALNSLPKIERTLHTANAIACAKELYELGELDENAYKGFLMGALIKSGFKYSKK